MFAKPGKQPKEEEGEEESAERVSLRKECDAVEKWLMQLPDEAAASVAGEGPRMRDSHPFHRYESHLLNLLSLVREEVPARCPRDVEEELELGKLVSQCKHSLAELLHGWQVRSIFLHSILTTFVKVCNGAAASMDMLNRPSFEVARWYSTVLQLADTVASDKLSLRLYELLRRFLKYCLSFLTHIKIILRLFREHLKSLLAGIGKAATKLLKLDPSLSSTT